MSRSILVIATNNQGKLREFRRLLEGCGFDLATPRDLGYAFDVEETGSTFAENARLKAAEAARLTGMLALADDSGLEVDALNGAPGVHSARFAALDERNAGAAGNSPDAANNVKLLRLLEKVPLAKRAARFRCVLALAEFNSQLPLANCQFFDGVCEGGISLSPGGQGGFGYDPLFVPLGHHQSFAELGEDVKNQLSHRAKALEKLRVWLLGA